MARTIKIDNAILKQFSRKKNVSKPRSLEAFFLIVCEGEKTEPNYFKAFPRKVNNIVYDIKIDGGGISTIKVVEKAIELREQSTQKFDRVWAVFDKDSFTAKSFNSAIFKAKANNISCAWSNEAFELWYLLHFHNRVTAMKRDEYKKAIEDAVNAKLKNKKKPFRYEKNDPGMYVFLQKVGNQKQAISWAESLSKSINGEKFALYNPQTMVFKLVQELNGQSKELNQEILQKHNDI